MAVCEKEMKAVAFGQLVLALGGGTSQTSLAGAASLDEYLQQQGYKPVVLSIPADRPKFTVQAVLPNGKKRLFVVDTGCGQTCLDQGSARGLKQIAEQPTSANDPAFGRLSDPKMVMMETLAFGSVRLTNQPVQIRPLQEDYVRFSFDGILGADFLYRNFCLLDCFKNRLYLRYSEASAEESRALAEFLRQSGFAEIPMHFDYGFTIAAEANGQPVCLLIDTGSPCNVLDDSQRDRLGVTVVKENLTGSSIQYELNARMVGLGKIGVHKVVAAKLNSLQIGQRKWKDAYLVLEDLKAWGAAKPGTPAEKVQGLFGFYPLIERGAVIDFVHSTLWFRPVK